MATLLIVFTLNLLGISLVNRVNFIVIALSVLLVVVLMVLAFKKTLRGDTLVRLLEPFTFGQRGIGGIASGAAILSLWFLGFVAVSTLAEEAQHPPRHPASDRRLDAAGRPAVRAGFLVGRPGVVAQLAGPLC